MLLLSSGNFFKINFFQKILSGTLSMSKGFDPYQDLICVPTLCKGYQQTTKELNYVLALQVTQTAEFSLGF